MKNGQVVSVDDLLHIQNFESPWTSWTEKEFRSELASEDSQQLYIHDTRGALNGFLFYRMLENEAWIVNMAVRDKGRGEGTRLLSHFLIQLAVTHPHISQVGLELSTANKGALGLYKKFNFKKISERKSYYSNGDDAWLMLRSMVNEKASKKQS